jgi:CRISPR-associated protein Cas5h
MVGGDESMKAVVFDVKGTIAHFRKPDTTSTQLTYPFITPTAIKGMVGAILGIEDFVTRDKVGLQLLSPVRTVAQQMSMLGKDGGTTFNRPTTIELVINPAYRIYYVGEEFAEALNQSLQAGHAVYPPYLGSAYALTWPRWKSTYNQVELVRSSEPVETSTVVPSRIIKELILQEGYHYSRAGGFLHQYKGQRIFEKSIDFIYERNGRSVTFIPHQNMDENIELARIGEKIVCLY